MEEGRGDRSGGGGERRARRRGGDTARFLSLQHLRYAECYSLNITKLERPILRLDTKRTDASLPRLKRGAGRGVACRVKV